MSDQTHWRKLVNNNYIGAHDLTPGQELKVTLESITKEMVKSPEGKDEEVVVCRFKGAKKPMILNKTNLKMIAKLHGPYIEDWKDKSVILYVANVRAFGETISALRVKNSKI